MYTVTYKEPVFKGLSRLIHRGKMNAAISSRYGGQAFCSFVRPKRKKTSPGLPRGKAPQMPCWPNYNLHNKAGGSPKFCFAASNVRMIREACNPQIQIGIPYERCGFNGPRGQRTTRTQQGLSLLMRRGMVILCAAAAENERGNLLLFLVVKQ